MNYESKNLENEIINISQKLSDNEKIFFPDFYILKDELEKTASIIEENFEKCMFPSFFLKDNKDLSSNPKKEFISNILNAIQEFLIKYINRCSYDDCSSKNSNCQVKCKSISKELISVFESLQKKLFKDLKAFLNSDPAAKNYNEIFLCYPGFKAIMSYRLSHELYKLGVPLLPRAISERAHSITGIDIHPAASIGEYFFIDHGTGVVIGETSVIGEHVKIYQGVTLGAISTKNNNDSKVMKKTTKRHPTIGNNVIIYTNATILGGTTVIGDGAVIGGNTWITYSVPANTKVFR